MRVFYMKQKALDTLQKDISDNLVKYELKYSWIDQYFIEKESPNYYFDTLIDIPEYELILGGPENDFNNAKIIFEAYRDKINPVQASDLRLWAYLAHVKHWDYMTTRWKIDVPDEDDEPDDGKKSSREKVIDRVKTRYFFGASRGKAFVRQGIARLYWGAYLTYDEGNNNPYEYTEYFFSKQDVFSSITERAYARNKVLVLAILKELKQYPQLSRKEIRLFLAKLNQAGAITVLDFLDEKHARQLCANIMKEVIKYEPCVKEGCTIKAYIEEKGATSIRDFIIIDGRLAIPGKMRLSNVSPENLVGLKVGTKFTISDKIYVIKEINEQIE